MKVDVLFQGFPGKITRGYMSWSSIVCVETKGVKILFDTGGMVERSELPKRFKEHGLAMNDIDMVVLSHFHHDHAMNIDYFPNAKILLHEKEYEWVKSDPDDWATPKFLFPYLESRKQLEIIKGEPEIAPGVQVILTPGHTPGCISLVLRDDDTPITVLAADAVKNIAELSTGEVGMSHDNEASARSIKRVRDLARVVVPGHDRILEIKEDRIIAVTSCHETIIVPKGVCDADGPRHLELVVEQTWLPKLEKGKCE